MFGHPKGLMILFFTEMWERFSFYGMKAILVLFLVSETGGGFGWDSDDALTLLGLYSMMVYVMSVPGGIIADRYIGQNKSVMIGGALLCGGHLLMALPAVWSFYTALVLLVLGVGLLKPNISTMVGGLYRNDVAKMNTGFTIFYMGINLGSFLATIVVAYVGEKIGWHLGFSLAGIGMLLGQAVFIYGQKYLKEVAGPPLLNRVEAQEKEPFTKIEKDRILVICISLLVVATFWIAFEQAAGLLTLYAKQYTQRVVFGFEIPASMFLSLNAGFILLFGGVVARFWAVRAGKGKTASSLLKMGVGTVIMGSGYLFLVGAVIERSAAADGKSAAFWLVGLYLFHTIGELCLSPVALTFITKVAPKRIAGTMMGVFWAVTGLSNFFAAEVGKLAGALGEKTIFVGLFVFAASVGMLLVLFARKINVLTHGAEETGEPDQKISDTGPEKWGSA